MSLFSCFSSNISNSSAVILRSLSNKLLCVSKNICKYLLTSSRLGKYESASFMITLLRLDPASLLQFSSGIFYIHPIYIYDTFNATDCFSQYESMACKQRFMRLLSNLYWNTFGRSPNLSNLMKRNLGASFFPEAVAR